MPSKLNAPAEIATSRLTVRPMLIADADWLHGIMRDPIAMQYWREPPHASMDVTREVVQGMVGDGAAQWVIVERQSSQCIGFVGFHSNQPPQGFGYLLDRRFWRRGYMFEACQAVLRFGFESLGYEQAEAWIHEENRASVQLARKLGFRQVGATAKRSMPHSAAPFRFLVYGLWASAFLGQGPHPSNGVGCHQIEPTLTVADVTRSVGFYTGLGFSVAFTFGEPPVYAAISSSPWSTGVRIRLRQFESEESVVCPEEIVLTLDDLDTLHARCTRLGMNPSVQQEPWGAREFAIVDPDGHRLRFTAW